MQQKDFSYNLLCELKQKTVHKSIYSADVQVMIFVKAEVIIAQKNFLDDLLGAIAFLSLSKKFQMILLRLKTLDTMPGVMMYINSSAQIY